MSLSMTPANNRQGAPEGTATIQKLLDENSQLLSRIKELQTLGKTEEINTHQQLLHRNLVFLAKAADQSLLSRLMPENPTPQVEHPAPTPQQQPSMNQMHPSQPMNMVSQMGMPHYSYPPQQGMHPHGYPGQPYDPQQQPPSGPPMGYMGPR